MASFGNLVKNIFLFLLLLQFAPLLITNIRKQYSSFFEQKTHVALIPIKNILLNSQCTVKQLKKFFMDPDIKAIVIAMECPGGSAGTSQTIFQELKALKTQYLKPVIIWVENICASGGYYVACAGDHIIASPSAFIGSIGVYIPLAQIKELMEQFKVKFDPVVSGSYKMAGNWFTQTTQQQRNMLQSLTNDTYDQFIKDVAQSRTKLALAQASEWADGRIFTGRQAFEKGLIDEVGSINSVENYIKQKVSVVGTIEYIKPPKQSPLTSLFGSDDCDDNSYMESTVQVLYNWYMKQNTAINT